MAIKKRNHRGRIDAEHHLRSAVIGLAAIFFAVSIYTYHYIGTPRVNSKAEALQPATLSKLTDLSDTPMDARTLTGTVKEFSGANRMVVRSTIVRNGQTSKRSYLVTVLATTKIITIDIPSQIRPGETSINQDPIRRTADRNAILTGRTVNITTLQSIDGQAPLDAQTVEIML